MFTCLYYKVYKYRYSPRLASFGKNGTMREETTALSRPTRDTVTSASFSSRLEARSVAKADSFSSRLVARRTAKADSFSDTRSATPASDVRCGPGLRQFLRSSRTATESALYDLESPLIGLNSSRPSSSSSGLDDICFSFRQ